MRNKFVLAMVVAAMLGVACTAGGDDTPTPSTGPTGSTSTSPEPVTVTLWAYWSGRELKEFEAMFDRFHELEPWITVDVSGGIDDLRRGDTITVVILDENRRVVRTLLSDGRVPAGKQVFFLGRERRERPNGSGSDVRATRRASRPAAHDHVAEPDRRRHHAADAASAVGRSRAQVLAGRRWKQRQLQHPLPPERARPSVPTRRRCGACPCTHAGKTTGKLDWYGKVRQPLGEPPGSYRITVLTRDSPAISRGPS